MTTTHHLQFFLADLHKSEVIFIEMLINFNKIKCRQGLGNTLLPCKILKHICLQIMPPSMKESLDASKRPTALYIIT